MTMGEIFDLKELAEDCAADRRLRVPVRRARDADHRRGRLAGQSAGDQIAVGSASLSPSPIDAGRVSVPRRLNKCPKRTRWPMQLVRNHSHWGAFLAEVEGGQIVGVRPFERDPDPSHLINAIPGGVHSKSRIAQPMVREGWLETGPGRRAARAAAASRSCRCRGTRRSIWSRASSTGCAASTATQSIMGGSQGWSSAGLLPRGARAASPVPRGRAAATSTGDELQLRRGARVPAAHPRLAAAWSGPLTSWSSIARHTKLMVLFGGANPKNTAGRARAAAPIALDPRLDRRGWRRPASSSSTSARCATTCPTPSTRSGFRSAPEHRHRADARRWPTRWSAKALHDRAFLARYCVGFERVLPYLLGESDGQPKDADWAAGDHRRAAPNDPRAGAADGGDAAPWSPRRWSLQRAHHGEQPYWVAIALAAMLGQIGLPGGGFGFGYGCGRRHRRCRAPAFAGARRCRRARTRSTVAIPVGAHRRHAAASRRAATTSTASAAPIPTSGWSTGPAAIRSTTTRTSTGCCRAWQQARDHRRARAVVDRDRAPRRHRAAGDHHAGAQRHRRRAPRSAS